MARTKQTARKAVAGKAPRKQLAGGALLAKRRLRNEPENEEAAPPSKFQRVSSCSEASTLNVLPVEILVIVVCKFLRYKDILALSVTKKEYHQAIVDEKNDRLWKHVAIHQVYGYEPLDADLKKFYSQPPLSRLPLDTNVHNWPRLWYTVVKNTIIRLKGNIVQKLRALGVSFSKLFAVHDLQKDSINFETESIEKPSSTLFNAEETEEELLDKYFALGESRVGGFPDFPAKLSLPRDGSGREVILMAQFNITQLKVLDLHNQLPEDGILWIFWPVASTFVEDSRKNPHVVIHMSNAEIQRNGGLERRIAAHNEEADSEVNERRYITPVKLEMQPISLSCQYNLLPNEIESIISNEVYTDVVFRHNWRNRIQVFGETEDGERNFITRGNMYWKQPFIIPPKHLLRNKQTVEKFVEENNKVYFLISNKQLTTNARVLFDIWKNSLTLDNKEEFATDLTFTFERAYRHIPFDYFAKRKVEKSLMPSLCLIRTFPEEQLLQHEATVSLLEQRGLLVPNGVDVNPLYSATLYKQLESQDEEELDACGMLYELSYKFIAALRRSQCQGDFGELEGPVSASYVNLIRMYIPSISQQWSGFIPIESFELKNFEGCVMQKL